MDPVFARAAADLGRCMARRKIDVVYGGGAHGMMGIVADTTMEKGGRVIGILPAGLASREKANEGVTELHIVDSMHDRKAMMERMSDGFIALPGGLGTLEEICEVTTWAQLGIHQKPLGILNVGGYFDHFLAFLDHAVTMGYLDPDHRRLLIVDDDPDGLIDAMSAFEPYLKKIWLDESEI